MTFIENNPELVFLCGFLLLYVLIQWFDETSSSDFLSENLQDYLSSADDKAESSQSDKQTIAELTERVVVLEKIVTDSRYELDQKLKNL